MAVLKCSIWGWCYMQSADELRRGLWLARTRRYWGHVIIM